MAEEQAKVPENTENAGTGCHCGVKKMKYRDKNGKEYKSLITRLNRIEGQVRGVKNMVETDRYCVDILTQVQATSCALNSFTKQVLSRHIKTCVADDIREGGEEKVDELVNLLQRLMK